MSLRQIAEELGISPAYLSYMLNGKRPWRKDLYQRYMGVVNTFVNSEAESVNNDPNPRSRTSGDTGVNLMVGVGRIELPTSCSQSRRPTAGLHPDVSEFNTPVGGRWGGELVSQTTNKPRPAGAVNIIC